MFLMTQRSTKEIALLLLLCAMAGCANKRPSSELDKEVYNIIDQKWDNSFGQKANYKITDTPPSILPTQILENTELTKTEFDIIALLAGRPNQVFSRAKILEHVRNDNYPITERVVDYQVTGLRKKLGKAGDYVKTVRGVGYKFEI